MPALGTKRNREEAQTKIKFRINDNLTLSYRSVVYRLTYDEEAHCKTYSRPTRAHIVSATELKAIPVGQLVFLAVSLRPSEWQNITIFMFVYVHSSLIDTLFHAPTSTPYLSLPTLPSLPLPSRTNCPLRTRLLLPRQWSLQITIPLSTQNNDIHAK